MTYFSICLFFVLFLHKAACLKFKTKGGDFILLDGEPENLLYENTFVHEWLLCRVNTSVISPYEYNKKGYINENCSNKNWDNKHPYLKYAWFYAGVPDTEIPTCDPLSAADSYSWNCEKNLLPNEVTPYRNCTPVCNEGYTLQHNVTARCSVNLTWTWFGDKDRQFCEKTHLPDSTPAPSDGFPITTASETFPSETTSEKFPSATTSEGFPSATASERPSNTVSTVSVSSNEIVSILSDLIASHINETALELTWKVSVSQESKYYPTRYSLAYNVQGKTTVNISLEGDLLNTTVSQLEPDTMYFFNLCDKENNERYETCVNTTVQTKAGGKKDTIYIIIGASIGGAIVVLAVLVCCLYRKRTPSSSSSSGPYLEFKVISENSGSSQNSSGHGQCCGLMETSVSDSSSGRLSNSSVTDSPYCNNKNENCKKNQDVRENNDTRQSTPSDLESANARGKRDGNKKRNMLTCRKSLSDKNNACMHEQLCGRSKSVRNKTDEDKSLELSLNKTLTELSSINTLEEPILSLTNDEKKEVLLQTCSKEEEANEEKIKPLKNENNDNNKFIYCERKPEIDQYIEVSLDENVPLLNDLTHNSSGLASVGANFNSPDLPKPTEYDKNLNVDGSRANSLHAMNLPSEMYSAQQYAAAAAEFHPFVNGNHCVMPKPDSFDYSGSSSSSPSHQKESKTLKHQNNKIAAKACIRNSQTHPSQGDRSSCDIDAMNNQVVDQNVSVGRGTHFNNSENSRDQNTRSAYSDGNKECEQVQSRLPPPLLLPQVRPVLSNRQSIETDGQDICPGSEDISQECHSLPVVPAVVCLSNYRTKSNEDRVSSTCTMPISKAKDELSLTFFVRLGYHIDPDSFYGPLKSWFGLSLQVLKLSEEEVQSIRHHSIGNPDKGHFLFTLGKYTGQGLYISDIVQYFVQCDSLREDVIQFIKQHHTDCGVCNRLYLTVTQSFSESTEDIRRISDEHHKKRNN